MLTDQAEKNMQLNNKSRYCHKIIKNPDDAKKTDFVEKKTQHRQHRYGCSGAPV